MIIEPLGRYRVPDATAHPHHSQCAGEGEGEGEAEAEAENSDGSTVEVRGSRVYYY
jgi:hypothetical protein